MTYIFATRDAVHYWDNQRNMNMVYGLCDINVQFLILMVTCRRLPLFVGNAMNLGVIGHCSVTYFQQGQNVKEM